MLNASAAGLSYYFDANALHLREERSGGDPLNICASLRRPAQADKLQLGMQITFGGQFWSATEDALNMDDTDLWHGLLQDVDTFPDTVQMTPSNMQQVAITGSWCRVLPDASWALWEVRHGYHAHGLTEGDDKAANLWDVYLAVGFDQCQCFEYSSGFSGFFPSISVSTEFTPFTTTCEVVGQSDWKLKRQQAKQQAKIKKVQAKGQKHKAWKSRSSQASWKCQDTDWVIP